MEDASDSLRWCAWGDVSREHRRSYPANLAVVDGDVRLTYVGLDDRVNRLANVLRGEHVEVGDRVVWLGQNSHRTLEAMLACAKLGATLCPANWRWSSEELENLLEDCEPRVVFWQEEEIGDRVRAVDDARMAGQRAVWIAHDSEAADAYEARVAQASPGEVDVRVDPSTALLQLYTAAFEGTPRGALLSHTALMLEALLVANGARIDASYVYLNSGPLFHIATWLWTLPTFLFAGTNVFLPRSDAERICELVERERCTGAFLMPPTIDAIVELNEGGRFDLSSLRAAPGRPEWNAMITVDDSPMSRQRGGYGQTEVTGLATFGWLGSPPEGGAGRPSPVAQVRIVDPDGEELPTGEVGEIVVRGPVVMNGYHRRPDETARRRAGGWHHTGDLGRRESDGSITFVGPMTTLIKSGAENIYPVEVESCLREHPDVKDCGVIGVPDPVWTQHVRAVVVPQPGTEPSQDELIEHCRARIASYKKPRSVIFVDELPQSGGGLDREALDALFGGGGYPGTQGTTDTTSRARTG